MMTETEVERLRVELAATRNGYDARGAEIAMLHGLVNELRNHLHAVLFNPIHPDPDGIRRCLFCDAEEVAGAEVGDETVDHDEWCATQRKAHILGSSAQ